MDANNYIVNSLELHLFFGRIMKEHSLFLKAGFTPVDTSFIKKAEYYKNEFEKLLSQAIFHSNGIISSNVLNSQELVTDFTVLAEKQTERFTGIAINKELTKRELQLSENCNRCKVDLAKTHMIKRLNQNAINLLNGLICFKETVLSNVLNCRMFTMNYPLLIEHIIREAKLYREYLEILEKEGCLSEKSMKDIECFWNKIMMEHAMFIRGLLDPSETELINSADGFAKDYGKLLEACNKAQKQALAEESLKVTLNFKNFKEAGTQGIEQCKVRSLILPLLADHVLREANHYIRLLKT